MSDGRPLPLPKRIWARLHAPSHSWRRLLNFSLLWLQREVLRSERVWGYPSALLIDPVNHCNLRCPLCPTGQGRRERSRGYMSLALFQKVIDELGPYLYEVYLHNWGEPLLHPEIVSMIRYAKRAGCRVMLSTNLTLLQEERARELVRSGLDEIIASIDGATPETYGWYRVGGDFARVVANLRLLVAAKREAGMTTPLVAWQFLVMRHNQHEVAAARQLAEQVGVDRLVFAGAMVDMGRERAEPVAVSLERDGPWLTTLEEYTRYDLAKRRLQAPLPACDWLWTKAVVQWDGAISPCCGVYDPAHDFGSVAHDSFRSQWNNPRFRAARRLMGRGQKSDIEVICRYCYQDGIKP